LTPSLQQAIKLLPMSTLELGELLTQEMVENPMLEEAQAEELQATDATPVTDKADEPPKEPKADAWDDQDYEYFFGDYLDEGYRPRAQQEIKELPPIESTLSTTTSLSDHLLWQLSIQTDDDVLREIGTAIIGNLDDDGYLVASVDEIASTTTATWWPRWTRSRRWGPGTSRTFPAPSRSCRVSTPSASPPAISRNACRFSCGRSAWKAPRPSGSSPSTSASSRTTRSPNWRASWAPRSRS
jgi:hypothetical protein